MLTELSILRQVSKEITPDYPDLSTLIADMWETMYSSNGVGLAAPQINRDIRLFLVDSQQIFANLEEGEKDKYPDGPGIKQVFINVTVAVVPSTVKSGPIMKAASVSPRSERTSCAVRK